MNEGEGLGPVLVGDVGGTNLRLALATRDSGGGAGKAGLSGVEERAHGPRIDLAEAVADYLSRSGVKGRISGVALAVAGPVIAGEASLTNAAGEVSGAALSKVAGGVPARLLNDFAALALAAGVLAGDDLHAIGPIVSGDPGATRVVMGPGTGLGVSALVRDAGGRAVASSEGSHSGFAPTDEVEVEVWRALTARHGRCSVERVLSGPGLLELHGALCGGRFDDPAHLVQAAHAGEPSASATIRRFCAILGSAAGDAALMFGARGGVLIGGGIAPRLLPWLEEGGFRARFEAKGRLAGYMAAIPTSVIVNPHATLIGAARAFDHTGDHASRRD